MNDLAIIGTSIGAGVAAGLLTTVASRNPVVGLVGASVGMAAGGIGAWSVQRDGGSLDLASPKHALPLLIGSGVGIGVAELATEYSSITRLGQGAAYAGAALVGGLVALSFVNGADW